MKKNMNGMSGHESSHMQTDVWLTPPEIIQSLGVFDIDPCASINRPWETAKNHYTIEDDGLQQKWEGRVWCNPPYGKESGLWLKRLVEHGNGIALIFARTETKVFFKYIWDEADALLFIRGRLWFYHDDGRRANMNAGAPSVLVAYGNENVQALQDSGIDGKFINLEKM